MLVVKLLVELGPCVVMYVDVELLDECPCVVMLAVELLACELDPCVVMSVIEFLSGAALQGFPPDPLLNVT